MDDEFYVSLVSNASTTLYPKNSNSEFVNQLAVPLDLKGDYEVCLNEIVHPLQFVKTQKVVFSLSFSAQANNDHKFWNSKPFAFKYQLPIDPEKFVESINDTIHHYARAYIDAFRLNFQRSKRSVPSKKSRNENVVKITPLPLQKNEIPSSRQPHALTSIQDAPITSEPAKTLAKLPTRKKPLQQGQQQTLTSSQNVLITPEPAKTLAAPSTRNQTTQQAQAKQQDYTAEQSPAQQEIQTNVGFYNLDDKEKEHMSKIVEFIVSDIKNLTRNQSLAPRFKYERNRIVYSPGHGPGTYIGIRIHNEEFIEMLGFYPQNFIVYYGIRDLIADFEPFLNREAQLMFIYSDIIRGHIVGDKISECLRVVPLTKTTSEDVGYLTFPTEQFFPTRSGRIDSIAIKIADEFGEPIPFKGLGKVYLTLKFRKLPI